MTSPIVDMAQQHLDPQKQVISANGITLQQEQQKSPVQLPKSLIEWLVRINRRHLALESKKGNDSG